MSRVRGVANHKRRLTETIRAALERPVRTRIMHHITEQLNTNTESDGTKRPRDSYAVQRKGKPTGEVVPAGEKASATVRAYSRTGYDPERYLVASGQSTRLQSKVTGNVKLTIEPRSQGKKVLGYHIPANRYRGEMQLFTLNDDVKRDIGNILKDWIKRGIR